MSNLRELKHKPEQTIVEMCETLLEMAKKGEVSGLVYSVQLRGGYTYADFRLGEGADRSHLYFAIDRAKHRLIEE